MTKRLMSDEVAIELVKVELMQARKKFPEWPHDDNIHAVAIVCEESGEAIRAALLHKYEYGEEEAIIREIIQTACVCIRFLTGH